MDAFLLVMAGIVIAVPAAILVMMFFLKGANAHKERLILEQEQLDKKNGVIPKPDSPENTGAKKKRGSERMIEHLPSFLVIVIGSMLIYWAYHSSLRPADVGSFGYEKWLTLVFITWGVLSALIALNAEKAVAKTLQSVLMWVMLALLIVLPLWSWVVTPSAPKPEDCPLFSSTKAHQCPITETGLVLSLGESIRPGEFEFCYIKPEKASMQSNWVGPTALKVRSTKGTFVLVYKMIKRENLVDGKCPEKL